MKGRLTPAHATPREPHARAPMSDRSKTVSNEKTDMPAFPAFVFERWREAEVEMGREV